MFHKSVAILLSGTAFSQLIGIIILPLLTRLYTTEEMGVLAVFSAAVTILLTVVCLRLESAVPIQKKESDAKEIFTLCIQLSVVTSAVTLLSCLIIFYFFTEWISSLGYYIFLIPLGMVVGGVYIALNSYALKNEKFELVSKSRIIQSLSCAVVQIFGYFIYHSALWLIIGFILNLGAGINYLKNKLKIRNIFEKPHFQKSKDILIKNANFPKFSVIESLSNTAGVQVPILLIAYGMSVSEAAFLFLAMKLIQAPMALLGSSISQVYYSQAHTKITTGELSKFTSDVLTSAMKVGVGPIITISLLAPSLTELGLGKEWKSVGEYIFIMSPWFIMQFISSPISPIMYITGMQKNFMYLTLFGLIWKLGFTFYAVLHGQHIVEYLVFANTVFYTICLIVFARAADISLKQIIRILYSSGWIIFIWIIFSLVFLYLINI